METIGFSLYLFFYFFKGQSHDVWLNRTSNSIATEYTMPCSYQLPDLEYLLYADIVTCLP